TVAQRVRGLRLGADDWVTKPCHPEEVLARVEAVVRRRRRMEVPTAKRAVQAGEVEIRSDQFQAFVGGASADLTRREFELIALLAFLPAGGNAATFISNVLSILFTIAMVWAAVWFYRMYRTEIYSLGDRHRALLYGSFGVALFAMAGHYKLFDTGVGTLAFVAM